MKDARAWAQPGGVSLPFPWQTQPTLEMTSFQWAVQKAPLGIFSEEPAATVPIPPTKYPEEQVHP